MDTLKTKPLANGQTEVTVRLAAGETLVGIKQRAHYQLADPPDSVVASQVLSDMKEVYWCSISQAWVESR
jgi:hypothetical protein